jgi:hypothetical protein
MTARRMNGKTMRMVVISWLTRRALRAIGMGKKAS